MATHREPDTNSDESRRSVSLGTSPLTLLSRVQQQNKCLLIFLCTCLVFLLACWTPLLLYCYQQFSAHCPIILPVSHLPSMFIYSTTAFTVTWIREKCSTRMVNVISSHHHHRPVAVDRDPTLTSPALHVQEPLTDPPPPPPLNS